ncbi:hypothetical protein RFI_00239 [Reticulomyxa filosa]|uniref:Uncharacterized protein n=1 Tax=Reticulomyxa filosa TaxID=46433 RepID=X6PFD5_RETFI|nr:hypothetical protein RFI_00239 [Reticulomyxa filosa]|eukprot:ETO36823.1 hypothetical protein RFI_00239 [Reticulomyxa filosa]
MNSKRMKDLLAMEIVDIIKEAGVPIAQPDQYPHFNKPLTQVLKLPIKFLFEKWIEPTQEEILTSLDNNAIVIFADGSIKPDPGIGGYCGKESKI